MLHGRVCVMGHRIDFTINLNERMFASPGNRILLLNARLEGLAAGLASFKKQGFFEKNIGT